MTDWFIQDGEQTLGPIPQADMARRAQQGDIAPFTPVRRASQQDWIMIEEATELWQSTAQQAAQAPAAAQVSSGKKFDPYSAWLGIPPERQPVDFYGLLGLPAFESDAQRIQTAAQQQVAKVQSQATEKQLKVAKRVRTEINSAKDCLLDAAKKQRYDQKLRALKPELASSPSSQQAPPPLPQQAPHTDNVVQLLEEEQTKPWFLQPAMLVAGVGALIVLLGSAVFFVTNMGTSNEQTADNNPIPTEPATPNDEQPKAAEEPRKKTSEPDQAEPVEQSPLPIVQPTPAEPARVELDLRALSQKAQPSVVQIVSLSFSGTQYGSGIVVDEETVLTSFHLVQSAAKVEVVLPTGAKGIADGFYSAHPELDLVLLHVKDLQGKPALVSAELPSAREQVALFGFTGEKDGYFSSAAGEIQEVGSGKSFEERLTAQLGGSIGGKPIEYSPSSLWLTVRTSQDVVGPGALMMNEAGEMIGMVAAVDDGKFLGLTGLAMQDALKQLAESEPSIQPLRVLNVPQIATRPSPLNPAPLNPTPTEPLTSPSMNPPATSGTTYNPQVYQQLSNEWQQGFSGMHSQAVELRGKWDEQAEKVESYQEELRPIIAVVNRLRTGIQQLENSIRREEVEAAQAQAAARSTDDPTLQNSYFSSYRLHKTRADSYRLEQRNLLGQLQAKEAEGQAVQNKLNAATSLAQQYAGQFDELSFKWLLACDLFGKYGREAHERNVQNMTQLTQQEDRIITPYLARATSYLQLEKYREAIIDLDAAMKLDQRPMTQAVLLSLRGQAHSLAGNEQQAMVDLGNAIKVSDGKAALALLFRAEVQASRGRHKQAGDDFRKAIRLAEDSYLIHMRQAHFLATCPADTYRKPELAKTSAEQACQLSQNSDWNAILTLAIACAALGEFSQAAEHVQQARSLAPPEQQSDLQARIATYQDGKIYQP